MKRFSIISFLLVSIVLMVSSCEKQKISEDVVEPIKDVKENTSFVGSNADFDICEDAAGNKLYLPRDKAPETEDVIL